MLHAGPHLLADRTPAGVGEEAGAPPRGVGQVFQQHGGSLRWGRRFKWPDYFFRGSWMIRGSQNKYIADIYIYSLYLYFELKNDPDKDHILGSAMRAIGKALPGMVRKIV